ARSRMAPSTPSPPSKGPAWTTWSSASACCRRKRSRLSPAPPSASAAPVTSASATPRHGRTWKRACAAWPVSSSAASNLPPGPPGRQSQEVLDDLRRARDHALALDAHRAAIAVQNDAARLLHQQNARRDVPGVEVV